jgi:c(7)-type cytochrome triheme protein
VEKVRKLHGQLHIEVDADQDGGAKTYTGHIPSLGPQALLRLQSLPPLGFPDEAHQLDDTGGDTSGQELRGKPGEAALISPKKAADLAKLKASAERLGTGLNLDLLPNKNSLPFDKFGNIDWMLLKKLKVHQPKSSIKGDSKKEIRDNEILFESPMPYVKNSVFSHTSHTEQIECASCHPEPFKEELGSTVANKAAMAQGASCGTCHNKVSFKFADCNRCHIRPIGEAPGKALLRKKQ